jgi:hypothetical protein
MNNGLDEKRRFNISAIYFHNKTGKKEISRITAPAAPFHPHR